jgi:hypothetical protein
LRNSGGEKIFDAGHARQKAYKILMGCQGRAGLIFAPAVKKRYVH